MTADPCTVRLPGLAPLRPGAELTVRGIGRARFRRAEVDDAGAVRWVDVYDKRGACRSVTPDRITTVHRTDKLRR